MAVTINQGAIDALVESVFSKVVPACESGALLIENKIDENTPVLTGNLRSNNTFQVTSDNATKVVTISYSNNTPYDPFVHNGTSRMAGRPYRNIGISQGMPDFIAHLKSSL